MTVTAKMRFPYFVYLLFFVTHLDISVVVGRFRNCLCMYPFFVQICLSTPRDDLLNLDGSALHRDLDSQIPPSCSF